MKRIFLFLFGCAVCLGTSAQRWLDLKTGELSEKKVSTIPYRDIEKTDDGYLVTYTFEKATILDDNLFPGTVCWKVEGFGLNDVPGEAEYLLRNDLFAIPAGMKARMQVVDSMFVDYPYELAPARQPLFESDKIGYTKDNVKPVTPFKGFQPASLTTLSAMQYYRGQGLCYASIYPLQYNFEEKKVRAYSSVTYKLTFEPNPQEGREQKKHFISPSDNFLRNVAIGYEQCRERQASLAPLRSLSQTDEEAIQDTRSYLIVSTPEYEEAVNRFAKWKRILGFNVHVALRNNWDTLAVRSMVRNIYNNFPPLYYLLIIGDYDDVPGEEDLCDDEPYVTDYNYGCIETYSFQAVRCGRLPVSSLAEAQTVISKIIAYEKNPPTNEAFYNKGVHCAYFEDEDVYDSVNNYYKTRRDGYEDVIFTETSEIIRSYLIENFGKSVERIYYAKPLVTPEYWNQQDYSYGHHLPWDLLREGGFQWNGNSIDVINAINDGAFYVLHRGHGEEDKWVFPKFDTRDINYLCNGNLTPVVFSINCLTGKYDSDCEPCFAEKILRKSNGGAVAVIAPTGSSYTLFNDALTCGMFDAIWPNPGLIPTYYGQTSHIIPTPTPTYILGQILQQGLHRMEETITAPYLSQINEHQKKMYHCFGDPGMHIYTEQPTNFDYL